MTKLICFFNIFNLHYKQKKHHFQIKYNKHYEPLLIWFIKLQIIKRVQLINQNTLMIWPNINHDQTVFTQLKLLYKKSNNRNIKLQTLKKLKNIRCDAVYLILSSKGLITNYQAVKLNTGGIFFCRLT